MWPSTSPRRLRRQWRDTKLPDSRGQTLTPRHYFQQTAHQQDMSGQAPELGYKHAYDQVFEKYSSHLKIPDKAKIMKFSDGRPTSRPIGAPYKIKWRGQPDNRELCTLAVVQPWPCTKLLRLCIQSLRGMRWRSWFRHCATRRKVAGSIPDDWHNPSGRTTALGLTQPLTVMSTRNIYWGGKGGRCVGPLCAECLEIW